ncbi:MAG TPA: nucleoside-diphosphate sugar epimerase/dehydratase, partial [Halanaerobiales bacterium]|nr:nucleoside-diphosphate sugar epimerase/dehydratase [Halanaerobiales bacterium]
ILMVSFYLLTISFSRGVVAINFILGIFFLGGIRFGLRILREYLLRLSTKQIKTRILVVGAGDAGEMTVREMQKHPEIGKYIIGLVDDNPVKSNLEIHGKKVLGNRNDIPSIIDKYRVDEVVIAIPSAKGEDIKEIYNLSNRKDVRVRIVPGVYEIINGEVDINQIREVKVEDLLRREQVKLNNQEIAGYLKGKRVMVTGGAGSIGSELCRQIARFEPDSLVILDINENEIYFLELELRKKFSELEIITVIASIQDKIKLNYIFNKYRPEVVFHAAAHKHVPLMENDPEEAVKNNIFGTKNAIELSDKYKVQHFVLISTDKAVNPTSVMGASKRVAEMFIQQYSCQSQTGFMAVRFGNVLGSCGSVIPIFKKQIAEGGPVTVTHPDVKRYFMTIPEAVQLVIQAGALGDGGEVFVLDMGEPVRIIDLARDLIELSGLKEGEDIKIEISGLRPGEKLFEELLLDGENIATEHERIFIAGIEKTNVNKVNSSLDILEEQIKKPDKEGIVDTLKELVVRYNPERDKKEEPENVIDYQDYRKEAAGTEE